MNKIAIYNPYLDTRGGGEKVCLALAEILSKKESTSVTLITHSEVDLESIANYFNLDLSRIEVLPVTFSGLIDKTINKLPIPGRIKNLFHDVKIYRRVKRNKFDTFINNCYQSNLPNPCVNGVYMCMFPQKIKSNNEASFIKKVYVSISKTLYRIVLHPTSSHAVYTYQTITANSVFTQSYIKKYWDLDSDILYPICDDMSSKDQAKKKVILNVGRFFENVGESHHKRQDFLLESFKKLTQLHKDGWELHFAGSVAEDAGTLKYILKLIRESTDMPIYLHFNCSFTQLKQLYNQASIYWHATGYGSNPDEHPEKQEHFGISTIEAMSTGAAPVVINSAGQKETITQGDTGFLWDTQSELLEFTTKVANNSEISTKISKAAKTKSKDYNHSAFVKNVNQIFK